MEFKIVGVDIIASYDEMASKPGDLRPLPTQVSALLAEELAESIEMQDVVAEAKLMPAISGDLTPALAVARQNVVDLMNKHLTDTSVDAVGVDNVAVEYQPTSTGGHNTISWVTQTATPGGSASYWGFTLTYQGQTIEAYPCLVITVQELPPVPGVA